MPYASVFPISQIFTSPLAVPMTFNGSSYKCVYEKTDISEELNGENYQITAEIPYSTAALIADGDTVTINAIAYKVSYRHDTPIGTVILYLSLADMSVTDPSLGTELLGATVINFTSAGWALYNGATKATNLLTLPAEAAYTPAQAIYEGYVSLDEGSTYCLTVDVETLDTGTLGITELEDFNFAFWVTTAGTHKLYFEARYYSTGYLKLSGINNTTAIEVTSISLKKVL